MHRENFLFLIRVKSGVLGLHQKSEIRTRKHHQRRPKPFQKSHTKNNIFRQKHTFRSYSFGKRPKVLEQQLYETDLGPETIETITLGRKPIETSTERLKQSQQSGEARSSILHRKKTTKHSVSVYIFQTSFLQKHGEKHHELQNEPPVLTGRKGEMISYCTVDCCITTHIKSGLVNLHQNSETRAKLIINENRKYSEKMHTQNTMFKHQLHLSQFEP